MTTRWRHDDSVSAHPFGPASSCGHPRGQRQMAPTIGLEDVVVGTRFPCTCRRVVVSTETPAGPQSSTSHGTAGRPRPGAEAPASGAGRRDHSSPAAAVRRDRPWPDGVGGQTSMSASAGTMAQPRTTRCHIAGNRPRLLDLVGPRHASPPPSTPPPPRRLRTGRRAVDRCDDVPSASRRPAVQALARAKSVSGAWAAMTNVGWTDLVARPGATAGEGHVHTCASALGPKDFSATAPGTSRRRSVDVYELASGLERRPHDPPAR